MSAGTQTGRARIVRGVLMLLFGIFCVSFLVRQLLAKREQILQAFDLGWGAVLVLALMMFASHLQRTIEFTFMLRRLDVQEPALDGFWLTGVALLLNYLPFNAGSVVRAMVLRRQHDLPYALYLSALMVGAVVNGSISALAGLIATAVETGGDPKALPLYVIFGGLSVAGAFAFRPPKFLIPSGSGLVARQLRRLTEGIEVIRGNGSGILVLAAVTVTKVVSNAVRMWICFGAFGLDVSLLDAVLLGSATLVMSLVNLTPGNLGVREMVLGGVSTILGCPPELGMAAASLDRAILFAYTLVLGVPGLYMIARRRKAEPA
ncbi:MAG TPA: lysylphosphatidylglycerol synthase transmembrane domain-containing protein [Polyangiaceae bacterium]